MTEEEKEHSKTVLLLSSSSIHEEEEAAVKDHPSHQDEEDLAKPSLRRDAPAIHRAVSTPGAYLSSPGITRRAASVAYHSLFHARSSDLVVPDNSTAARQAPLPVEDEVAIAPEDNTFHPVATIIPNDSFDIPVAEELQGDPKQREEKRKTLLLGGLFVVLIMSIGIGLTVGLSLRHEDSRSQNEGSLGKQTLPPTTMSPENQLLNMLPKHTLLALERAASPQSNAFEWLVGDPSLEYYSPSRQLTRFALATLYYATKGDTAWKEKTHWLDYDQHECLWFAILNSGPIHAEYYQPLQTPPCDDDGVYRELSLYGNGLRGTIPEEVYLLTSLRSFIVYDNELTGTISTRIGKLTSLVAFAIFTNDLSGTIPSQLGLLHDRLEGYFSFYNPRLSGTIPPSVGALTHLKHFLSEGCAITGTIPSEIGALATLRELKLNQNELVGMVPTELGNLHLVDAVMLYQNMLTGPIPSEFGTMSSLLWLELQENDMTGTIPTSIAQISQLQSIFLGNNQLTGNVPSEFGLLSDLKEFQLNSNALTGIICSEFALLGINAASLWLFNVSDTFLSGEMPSELCPLDTLVFDCRGSLCGCDCPCE